MSAVRTLAAGGIAVLLVPSAVQLSSADDRVWLAPQQRTSTESDWYPRGIEKLDGKVVDFDADQLRFIPAGQEREKLIGANRVVWIEPDRGSNSQREMIELFSAANYSQSLSKLPAVLQERPPVWRQQWLTMLASVAAWKSGRSKISLELVAQLDRRPLSPLALSWLPVAWAGGEQNPTAIAEARSRLDDASPAARLVAASWLLSSDRAAALKALSEVRQGERKTIARLAEIVSWRVAAPPEVKRSAQKWQQQIQRLPLVLQQGPMQTLVDKFRAAGLSEESTHLQWSLELTPVHTLMPIPEF